MAFVDEITIHMKAGKGGNGLVTWLKEKGREWGGPAGGDGGRGGDVYVRGVRDYAILAKYRNIKDFAAQDGENGKSKSMWGKNGDDLVLDVPVGSVIMNLDNGKKVQVLREGELVFLLKGGKGGFGNLHFKASTNVSPMQSTPGREGEVAEFLIELHLLVDMGFAGFPNAGKSSLLNVLTHASAKVGAYQFTTLEPNLGALYGYVLADIPGLIEGASEGKGLGFKFLRHIDRTKAVLHCLSLENEDIKAAYKTIRKELETFSPELAEKPEILLLTKTDIVTPGVLKKKLAEAKKLNKTCYAVSILDDESVKKLKDVLVKTLRTFDEKAEKAKAKEEKKANAKGKKPEKSSGKDFSGPSQVRFESDSIPTTHLEERAERAVKKLKRSGK